MKKALSFIAILAAFLPLLASYSLALPDKSNPHYQVIAENGDTIDLDDYVWSKRWNGLELSQSMENIYTINDGGYTVLAAPPEAEWDDIKMEIRFALSTPSLLILQSSDIDEEFLQDEGIRDVLFISQRISERDKAKAEAMGITLHEAKYGDVLKIDDGLYLPERSESVSVRCPHCGRTFTLYI